MFDKFKYFAWSVALLATLPACSSSDNSSDDPVDGVEMKFTARGVSRSVLTSNATVTGKPFEVYGDMVSLSASADTKPSVVFNKTAVTYSNSAWSYTDTQYWFPNNIYSFVAVHPAGMVTPNYDYNTLSFTYTYPDNYQEVPDILTATHRRHYETTGASPVAFNFDHIMSRINFIARVDDAVTEAVVFKSFEFEGIYGTATYSVTPGMVTSAETQNNEKIASWTIDKNVEAKTIFSINPNQSVTGGGSFELFPSTDPLLIIPQEVTGAVRLKMTYSIGGVDQEPVYGYLYSPSVAAHGAIWLPGQSYTYAFTVGVHEYIIFSHPSVKDWEEDEGGNYVITD